MISRVIDDEITLVKYYPNYKTALEWYQDLFYKKCGFSMPEVTNATMEYNGFRMSRKDRG